MDQRLERILPRVQKPARYTGGEYRQIIKDKAEVDLRLAFCFPDIRSACRTSACASSMPR